LSNCLAQRLIDGKLKELYWLFCFENQCLMGIMGYPIGVDNPYSACISLDFSIKKEKIFKKLSIFPLPIQTIPLPLHSK
jgi:hypothetical protein